MRSLAFLLFALFFGAFALCAQNCDVVTSLLPNILAIGTGVDLFSGQRKQLSIIQMTCDESKKTTILGTSQIFPDQVESIQTSSFNTKEQSFMFTSFSSLQSQYSTSVQGSAPIKVATLGLKMSDSIEIYTTKKSVLMISSQSVPKFSAVLKPSVISLVNWSAEFKLAVDKLPTTYNYDTYKDFIDTWGTHVIKKGDWGGSITSTSQVVEASLKTHQQSDFEAQGSTLIGKYSAGTSFSASKGSDWFESSTTTSYNRIGGDAITNDVAVWKNSLATTPSLIDFDLYEIQDLLAPHKQALADNFAKAVAEYKENLGGLEKCVYTNNGNGIFYYKTPCIDNSYTQSLDYAARVVTTGKKVYSTCPTSEGKSVPYYYPFKSSDGKNGYVRDAYYLSQCQTKSSAISLKSFKAVTLLLLAIFLIH